MIRYIFFPLPIHLSLSIHMHVTIHTYAFSRHMFYKCSCHVSLWWKGKRGNCMCKNVCFSDTKLTIPVYEDLRYWRFKTSYTTSVWGLKILVYPTLRYSCMWCLSTSVRDFHPGHPPPLSVSVVALLYHPKPTSPSRHESRRYLYFCTSKVITSTPLVCPVNVFLLHKSIHISR
jgi:hypothetical protein